MRQSAIPQHSAPVPGWRRLLYHGVKRGSALSGGSAATGAQTSAAPSGTLRQSQANLCAVAFLRNFPAPPAPGVGVDSDQSIAIGEGLSSESSGLACE